jgi:HSP20 family protein
MLKLFPGDVFDFGLLSPFGNEIFGNDPWMKVDAQEFKDKVLFHVDLPGVEEKDIKVEVHDGRLEIAAERASVGDRTILKERYVGKATRAFQLGDQLDTDKVTAKYKNGVLTVEIPRRDAVQPRKIPILSQ